MTKQFWMAVSIKDGKEVNLIFKTKKTAEQWLADQVNKNDYFLKKYSMI